MHFQRNLLARAGKANKPVANAVAKTFAGSLGRIAFARSLAETDRDRAHARWREVADSLRDRFRDVAELMDGEGVKRSIRGIDRSRNEHDVLAYMASDESLRSKLHGTTPLERVNEAIKRRTNVVGILPNREAVVPLVGAFAMDLGPCVDGSRVARALFGSGVWSVAAMCTASKLQRLGCAP